MSESFSYFNGDMANYNIENNDFPIENINST